MVVSVILVSRNTRELTCAAVRSVFESTDDFAKEVIVVDNGSTDDTPQVLPREFPKVELPAFRVQPRLCQGQQPGRRLGDGRVPAAAEFGRAP